MDISVAAVRLAFIALPGLIAAQVYRKLRGRRPKETWETFFEVLFFSVSSYTLWILVTIGWSSFRAWKYPNLPSSTPTATSQSTSVHISTAQPNLPHNIESPPAVAPPREEFVSPLTTAIFDEKASPQWLELIPSTIAPSCVVGGLLALLASLVHNRKWLNRFARRIGVSKRSGDEDLWENILNDEITDEWIFIRDHKLSLIYFGHPALYSESQMPRELVLTDVSVFSSIDTSKALYTTKVLYLSRQSDELTIEVPFIPSQEVTHVDQITDNGGRPPSHRGRHGETGRSEAGGDNPKA